MEWAHANEPPDRRSWRRLRVILTALMLCRGLVLLCVIPPFEAWDEYQHVAYIVHLNETGQRPWFGQSAVPASLLAQLPQFPHPRSALQQMGSTGAVGYTEYWARAGREKTNVSSTVAPGRIGLYQAQHGALYYKLVVPLFDRLGGVSNPRLSIGGLRLLNLFLTAGSVWVALGIIARSVNHRSVATFCGLLISTQPLFLMNGVRVANDALGVFLATISIAATLEMPVRLRQGRAIASSFGLGLVVGLAVLAKSVHFGLIPSIGAAWLWAVVRDFRSDAHRIVMRRAVVAALAVAAGFLVTTQSELRANWARYGSLTVMQEALINRQAGHGLSDLFEAARSISWPSFVERLWFRKNVMSGGWSWAGGNMRMQDRHEFLVVISLLGWEWMLLPARRARMGRLFQDPGLPWLCLALCVGYTASLSYHAVQSQLCWGTASTNPWYAAAAYPWFLLLVTTGAFAWPVGRFRVVLPVLLFLFFVNSETEIVLGSMISTYTAGADWGEALARLAFLQPRLLGTTTLYLALGGVLVLASAAIAETLRLARESLRTRQVSTGPHISVPLAATHGAAALRRASVECIPTGRPD